MDKISKYFNRHEVACKCGCGFDSMDAETLKLADEVREFEGRPITPRSGARCKEHNTKVGGGKRSQHLYARAMDLPVTSPDEVYAYLCAKYPGMYGFGVYDTFVHIDTRTNGPARWDKRSRNDGDMG
jgi:uncharacterized protein YcbK (DUF882 family)